jgi:hypothetical protein
MAEIGLLKRDQLEYNKSGMIKGLKDPSAILNNQKAAMNFGDWVMNTLKPRLDTKLVGLTGDARHIREAQLISAMFPDRNAAKAITEILQQFTKFSKDAKLMAEAYKSLNMEDYVDKSWEGQKQAFHEQWENFLQALGSPLVGPATDALRRLNTALAGMAQWASRPEMADTILNIGKGIAVLGVALTGGGAVALLAALGPAGWIAVGIVAVTGAFIAFKEPMEAWVRSVTGLGTVLDGLDAKFNEAAKAFGDLIAKIIQTLTLGLTGSGAIINGGRPSGTLPDELPGLPVQPGSYSPGGGGGGGGGGASAVAVPQNVSMTDAERNTLGLILQHESHGRNVMNYVGSRQGLNANAARGYTAQGYYQILNSNWRRLAPRLGITAPNAMSASLEDQTRVALALKRESGVGNWSNFNPSLRNALRRGDRARTAPDAPERPTVTSPNTPRMIQATLHVNLDGRRIATNVSRHQFNSANGPATAANFSDASEMYPQVA